MSGKKRKPISRPSGTTTNAALLRGQVRPFERSVERDFNPDYSDVKKDLKRIAALAGIFIAFLIILAFVLPLIQP
jgi:hypothetical protein